MATLTKTEVAKDRARFMQAYAKRYNAGAFATPTAKEFEETPEGNVFDIQDANGRTLFVTKFVRSRGLRRDFTGRKYALPNGAWIVTHIARTQGHDVPPLNIFDYVYAYMEDEELTTALRLAGRVPHAYHVSAASELTVCWGKDAAQALWYWLEDVVSIRRIPFEVRPSLREPILGELAKLSGWDDDYPFYSDGSWSALNLKGFWPEDPRRGVKPSEMPRKWQNEHPEDMRRKCEWTTLSKQCPAIGATVGDFAERIGWPELERVRLLRMAGRGGRTGVLRRHTDITDRAAGTRDGQIARFHIPLISHPDIHMTVWNLEGYAFHNHLAPWEAWYFDQRKPHAVTNPSGIDRIHLVVDAVVNEAVREQIRDV